MAQSVERSTLAQVMISQSVSSSPASGSVLMAQSLEPASDSVSLCPFPAHALSLFVSKIKIKKIIPMSVAGKTSKQIQDLGSCLYGPLREGQSFV